jgi:Ca-activated chloride channel family protein
MSPTDLFVRSWGLPLLLLAPLLWWGLRGLEARRARRGGALVGPRAAVLMRGVRSGRRAVRHALFAAGLLLALSAALHPVFGAPSRVHAWEGVDLVLCLDVSRSMLARDVAPDRLARARQEVHALAQRAQGDRLALVVFAGEARVVAPLTRDAESVAVLADLADPTSVVRGGTDLGAALETALGLLEAGAGSAQAVVLLTDGEDLEEHGLATARRCKERGIAVHAVGLGTGLGGKIALEAGGSGAFLKDRTGAEVVTALDAASLRRITQAADGAFVDAGASPQPLVDLYEQRVLPMARSAVDRAGRLEREDRFQWPLLAAVLLWLFDLALAERSRR